MGWALGLRLRMDGLEFRNQTRPYSRRVCVNISWEAVRVAK